MTWPKLDDEQLTRRINALMRGGLSARAAVAQAFAEQGR